MRFSRQGRAAGTGAWLRWMPAVAVPAVIAAVVIAAPLQAAAPVHLPAKTADQLVVMVADSKVQALSGTLDETVDLGLPQLPAGAPGANDGGATTGAGGVANALEFLTGPHTVRIFLDGASKQRVQLLDTMAERDVVRNGNTVWSYDSASNTATMLTLPAAPYVNSAHFYRPGYVGPDTGKRVVPTPIPIPPESGTIALTPAQVAGKFLAGLGPSTAVSVGPNTLVAGHPAYQLVLTPRTAETLVGKVRIAVDSATGLPLAVTVQARGSTATAFGLAFSQVTLAAPPASMFTFTPPAGATVTRQTMPRPGGVNELSKLPGILPAPGTAVSGALRPTVTGTGWTSIVHTPAGTVPATLANSPQLAQLLQAVPGGRALQTTLFTALVTPDGRLFAGAVPLAALQAAAQHATVAGK